MLKSESFNVYTTDLGEEGVDLGKLYDYDIILLDPHAYGRGPKGEVWHFFEDIPALLDDVRRLQSPAPLMTVLTSYAIRASSLALHEAMQEVFAGLDGRIESGELVLRQEDGGRYLSTSMFARFVAGGCVLS